MTAKWDEFLSEENSALMRERSRYREAIRRLVRDLVHLRWGTRRAHELGPCDAECDRRVGRALVEERLYDLFPKEVTKNDIDTMRGPASNTPNAGDGL